MRKSVWLKALVFLMVTFCHTLQAQDIATIKQQEAFKINGSLTAMLQYYGSDKTNPSHSPFMWYLQGSPVVTLYGIVLPFNFRLSEQQRDFRQPFNQFGVSPYYKWARLHLGYRSHSWSTYALAGHSISGAGLELSPCKFQFGVASGRLLKPVKYIDDPNYIPMQTPAFKRMGTAIKFGYGTDQNNISIIILKARDDSASLPGIPADYKLTPDENMVISLVSKQTLAKNFIFAFEIAQSLYTKDVRSDISDPGDNLMAKTFSFLIKNHESTRSNMAVQGSLGYQSDPFNLMLKYQRVEPDFRSMGAYYFATDLSDITIEPTIKLWQNKLTLGGSVGTQVDNLNKDKNLRTRRTISSARINFIPVQFYNLNAFYSNYGLAQESGLMSIDTLRQSEVAQATSQLGITQSVNFMSENFGHNIMLNYNYQKLNDKNENTAQYSEFSTNIITASYFLNIIPLDANASLSYLYTGFKQDTTHTVFSGPSISLGKSLFKNTFSTALSYTLMMNRFQEKDAGNLNTISFQVDYRPAKNHRFGLRLYYNKNNTESSFSNPYYENKLNFDYTYTF